MLFVLVGGVVTYWFVNERGSGVAAEAEAPPAAEAARRAVTTSDQVGLG